MLIILYYLNKMKEANNVLLKLLVAEKPQQEYINMTNYNLKYFLPHIKKDSWEFYAKFQRYALKFGVPEDIKQQINKQFEE